MSIVTKTGDLGTTGLMYNRRVSKCHPRVEAYGCVDELNSALGLARAMTPHGFIRDRLVPIQRDLVTLMGELATATEDLPRYVADGFKLVEPGMTTSLEGVVEELEKQRLDYRGWAMPGDTADAAALDVARTVCRRAERRVCALHEAGQLHNAAIIVFLNRLADLLWLMARWAEGHPASKPAPE